MPPDIADEKRDNSVFLFSFMIHEWAYPYRNYIYDSFI